MDEKKDVKEAAICCHASQKTVYQHDGSIDSLEEQNYVSTFGLNGAKIQST